MYLCCVCLPWPRLLTPLTPRAWRNARSPFQDPTNYGDLSNLPSPFNTEVFPQHSIPGVLAVQCSYMPAIVQCNFAPPEVHPQVRVMQEHSSGLQEERPGYLSLPTVNVPIQMWGWETRRMGLQSLLSIAAIRQVLLGKMGTNFWSRIPTAAFLSHPTGPGSQRPQKTCKPPPPIWRAMSRTKIVSRLGLYCMKGHSSSSRPQQTSACSCAVHWTV